jgi:hypothetical protein
VTVLALKYDTHDVLMRCYCTGAAAREIHYFLKVWLRFFYCNPKKIIFISQYLLFTDDLSLIIIIIFYVNVVYQGCYHYVSKLLRKLGQN